ncbi:hypothetical protein [Dyadobacter psychrotolerans]|uniref:Uncharacterized protein n=1 Tax=Dyadobacter psychrotolerans TaxID=2541721 RepID=A0A4R5DTF0_9BACT|nr:hypothetical protein [Dyadobacter psychrotolerans]TDE17689.1 hypothetical protein E0F88_07305 [Dyadobacter psychrotolerans]
MEKKGGIEGFEEFAQKVEDDKERTEFVKRWEDSHIPHPRFLTRLKTALGMLEVWRFPALEPDELERLKKKGPLHPAAKFMTELLLILIILPCMLYKIGYRLVTTGSIYGK